jgi:hypothetical protein
MMRQTFDAFADAMRAARICQRIGRLVDDASIPRKPDIDKLMRLGWPDAGGPRQQTTEPISPGETDQAKANVLRAMDAAPMPQKELCSSPRTHCVA